MVADDKFKPANESIWEGRPGSRLVCLDKDGIGTLTDGCLDLSIGP
jgi:hypothetical protein